MCVCYKTVPCTYAIFFSWPAYVIFKMNLKYIKVNIENWILFNWTYWGIKIVLNRINDLSNQPYHQHTRSRRFVEQVLFFDLLLFICLEKMSEWSPVVMTHTQHRETNTYWEKNTERWVVQSIPAPGIKIWFIKTHTCNYLTLSIVTMWKKSCFFQYVHFFHHCYHIMVRLLIAQCHIRQFRDKTYHIIIRSAYRLKCNDLTL